MDTATKTGMDAAKPASKRVVQETAEATGDLEIKWLIKLRQQVNQKKQKQRYDPPEKRQQIIDDLRLF